MSDSLALAHSPLSRRQFGLLVAGSAAVVAVGSTVVASMGGSGGAAAVATSFGSVVIDRAKRIARFGTGTFDVAAGGDGHGHGAAPADPSRAPVNLTWADVVVLWLAVTNSGPASLSLSPGQLRLRIVGEGTTVTPRNFGSRRVDVPPGTSATTWVSYLAPASASSGFLAEFTDPALDGSLVLTIPGALALAEARTGAEPWAA